MNVNTTTRLARLRMGIAKAVARACSVLQFHAINTFVPSEAGALAARSRRVGRFQTSQLQVWSPAGLSDRDRACLRQLHRRPGPAAVMSRRSDVLRTVLAPSVASIHVSPVRSNFSKSAEFPLLCNGRLGPFAVTVLPIALASRAAATACAAVQSTASFFRRWRTAGMRLRSASEPPS
jgi:hypothetical protein